MISVNTGIASALRFRVKYTFANKAFAVQAFVLPKLVGGIDAYFREFPLAAANCKSAIINL